MAQFTENKFYLMPDDHGDVRIKGPFDTADAARQNAAGLQRAHTVVMLDSSGKWELTK